MSNEVELKLAVTSDAFDTLKTHLNQFNILEQNTVFLEIPISIIRSFFG